MEDRYNPKDYGLREFIRDSRFLESAHFNLDYSPDFDPNFWDEEKVSVMREIVKIFYKKRLYGPDGVPIHVDECEDERIREAFRNIYCQKAINMDVFRKSVLENLQQDWRNYLLAREIARIDRDRDLEYVCDERIGIVLDSMSPEDMKDALEEIHKRENSYRLMHAKP